MTQKRVSSSKKTPTTKAKTETSDEVMSTPLRLIKKYPNRRLYDTKTSSYITLPEIKKMVLMNEQFQVVDAKTNDNITRSILLQVILEEETAGVPLFTETMLAQVIRFYGHAMQGMMGAYLEKNLQVMIELQERMATQMDGLYPMNSQNHQDSWASFMSLQAPVIQGMLNNYMDQNKQLFVQMQEQLNHQTRHLLTSLSGAIK